MKLLGKDFVSNGPGSVKMTPIDADDLCFAYNLIAPGDFVMAVTIRQVLRESASRGTDAERVKLTLEIKVEEVRLFILLAVLGALRVMMIVMPG